MTCINDGNEIFYYTEVLVNYACQSVIYRVCLHCDVLLDLQISHQDCQHKPFDSLTETKTEGH